MDLQLLLAITANVMVFVPHTPTSAPATNSKKHRHFKGDAFYLTNQLFHNFHRFSITILYYGIRAVSKCQAIFQQ